MATNINPYLEKLKTYLNKILNTLARIYRPGMSPKGVVQNIIDWTGDKNIAIGAAVL